MGAGIAEAKGRSAPMSKRRDNCPNSGRPFSATVFDPKPEPSDEESSRRKAQSDEAMSRPKKFIREQVGILRRWPDLSQNQRTSLSMKIHLENGQ